MSAVFHLINTKKQLGLRAVPLIRWLVADFSQRRPGFDPMSGHVGFVVDKVTLGHVSSENFIAQSI
jgi:hypothetical protein